MAALRICIFQEALREDASRDELERQVELLGREYRLVLGLGPNRDLRGNSNCSMPKRSIKNFVCTNSYDNFYALILSYSHFNYQTV